VIEVGIVNSGYRKLLAATWHGAAAADDGQTT